MPSVKHTGRTLSVPSGVMIGVCSALTATLCGSALTAKMIDINWIQQESVGYAIMTTLMVSAWIGATIAYQKIKRRKIMIVLFTGITFFIALLSITALFFGGQYSGVGETGLLVLGGSLISIFLNLDGSGRQKHRKRKKHYR